MADKAGLSSHITNHSAQTNVDFSTNETKFCVFSYQNYIYLLREKKKKKFS